MPRYSKIQTMVRAFTALMMMILGATGFCYGADRIEIVLDNSAAMWQNLGTDGPRILAVRQGLEELMLLADSDQSAVEIGLRTAGGRTDAWSGLECEDSEALIPIGPVDPHAWREIVAGLHPRGKRPLVRAVEAAAADLGDSSHSRRLVILTAGGDQCSEDIAGTITSLTKGDEAIEVRIVGLGLDVATANAATMITATRNANDAVSLLENLQWAVFSGAGDTLRTRSLEFRLTRSGTQIQDGQFQIHHQIRDEPLTTPIEAGAARFDLHPGKYRARLTGPGFEPIELADIRHGTKDEVISLLLPDIPVVTLSADPESPPAGGSVFVQYWGAPEGVNWIDLAPADAPFGEFLSRVPAVGVSGEVELKTPGAPGNLEARWVHELSQGVVLSLGTTRFSSALGTASIQSPETVENKTPLLMTWDGPSLAGDRITISKVEASSNEHAICVPAVSPGPLTVTAPDEPGEYLIRYMTAFGRTLERVPLEVFEILATLDGPAKVEPGAVVDVVWWGPGGPQDFLSIAALESRAEDYLGWAPTRDGNPAQLRAPGPGGDYELRYVRSEDGEILARKMITVVVEEITLIAPKVIEAGTRFEVEWNGTAGKGDFVAVAPEGAKPRRYLDWTYATAGSPLSLAAPFKGGEFEVRYISGSNLEILARATIEVR